MKHISTFLVLVVLLVFGSINQLSAQFILQANPGPPNNGGSPGWAMFFDLIAGAQDITVTDMTTASTAAASSGFSIEFFVRSGTALGGPANSGPGSSPAGWTSLGSVPVTQGTTSSGESLLFSTPAITVTAGDTTGVAMLFSTAGPRYFGTGTPPLEVYSDANLTLITGDGRSAPFTPTGSWFSSRALVGEIHYDLGVPVELTSFTASVIGNSAELKWNTATELNNSGFNIERKTESSTSWENIGFVSGHGTTTEAQFYSYTDNNLEAGSYNYRLKQVDLNGSSKYYNLAEVVKIVSPETFNLSQNYPNPFNPTTKISWQIPAESYVTLKVYDLLGNEVATLVNEEKTAGIYEVEFDASRLTSGTYFYTLKSGGFISTKKLMLIK